MPDFTFRVQDEAGNESSLVLPVSVQGAPTADLYVSPSGSDSAAGTQAAPLRTFQRAYERAQHGQVVSIGTGSYPSQRIPSNGSWTTGKQVTFRGEPGNVIYSLDVDAPNVIFDGLRLDARRDNIGGPVFGSTAELHGVVFKNGSIGNVTDQKGAQVGRIVFDNVRIHDVYQITDGVHNEGIYAIFAEGFVMRNSIIENCATMDLFFTSGTWWNPPSDPYGNIVLENNQFFHSTMPDGSPHYYSVVIGFTDGAASGSGYWGPLNNWTIRNNWFENAVTWSGDDARPFTNSTICGNTGACPSNWKAACA